MIKPLEIFVLLAVAVAMLILVLVGVTPGAKAESWPYNQFSDAVAGDRVAPRRYRKPRVYRPRKAHKPVKSRAAHGFHPPAVVKAWRKLDGFQDNRHCKDIVEAVGQRRASNDRAMDDVKENWHQIVVSKYGVMFADIQNARQITDACVSVSRPGVLSNTSEILTREKLQDRQCILKARPCGPKESR
jgi:hypothetical protein